MKLGKCKQALADLINSNGGWVDGEAIFAAMDGNGDLFGYSGRPQWTVSHGHWYGHTLTCWFFSPVVMKNHHQTILSREEYFFLHQNQGLEDALDEPMVEAKSTIEQLAQDYRNAKDYADRLQKEAGEAAVKAEEFAVEIRKKILELQELIGIPNTEKKPELVITNWRDLRVDDLIWYGGDDELSPGEYHVMEIETPDYEGYRTVLVNGDSGGHWIDTRAGWGFIRRP